jgi:hypothetical protein
LYEVIYASAQTRLLLPKQLSELLTGARSRNQSLDVSGLLLRQGTGFLQILEGDEAVVAALYERIAKDPRHSQVAVMRRGPIPARQFGAWNIFLHKGAVTAAANAERLRGVLAGFR